jgi:S1-C subfamily serine protease
VFNSPAYNAGIIEGDKILEVGGIKVGNIADVENIFENNPPNQGSNIKILIERRGKSIDVELKFPAIPKYPLQKRYKEEEKTGTQI